MILAEVTTEVDRTRRRLKRAHFSQRLDEVMGDFRVTWGVLRKYWVGGVKGGLGLPVAIIERMGLG